VAVITGAGSGLGRRIARTLLTAGWRVAVAGRREPELGDTVSLAAARPGSALVVPTDVSVPESVAALFGAVQRQWGRVDQVVSNAGVFAHSPRPRSVGYTATKQGRSLPSRLSTLSTSRTPSCTWRLSRSTPTCSS